MASYNDFDDEEEDDDSSRASGTTPTASDDPVSLPAAGPVPNPVIRSFDTPRA